MRRVWSVIVVNDAVPGAGHTVIVEASDTITDVKLKIARMIGCTAQSVRIFLEPVSYDVLHWFEVSEDSTLFVLVASRLALACLHTVDADVLAPGVFLKKKNHERSYCSVIRLAT